MLDCMQGKFRYMMLDRACQTLPFGGKTRMRESDQSKGNKPTDLEAA